MGKFVDRTGQKYGKWTVIEYDHRNKTAYWKCICDCGNTRIVDGKSLENKKSQSCGCRRKENFKNPLEILIGQKFGKLLVIEKSEKVESRNGKSVIKWLCQCDCGNTKLIASGSLRNGLTKSCGCIKKGRKRKDGTIGVDDFDVSAFNGLYGSYKRCAKDKKLEFNLSNMQKGLWDKMSFILG